MTKIVSKVKDVFSASVDYARGDDKNWSRGLNLITLLNTLSMIVIGMFTFALNRGNSELEEKLRTRDSEIREAFLDLQKKIVTATDANAQNVDQLNSQMKLSLTATSILENILSRYFFITESDVSNLTIPPDSLGKIQKLNEELRREFLLHGRIDRKTSDELFDLVEASMPSIQSVLESQGLIPVQNILVHNAKRELWLSNGFAPSDGSPYISAGHRYSDLISLLLELPDDDVVANATRYLSRVMMNEPNQREDWEDFRECVGRALEKQGGNSLDDTQLEKLATLIEADIELHRSHSH